LLGVSGIPGKSELVGLNSLCSEVVYVDLHCEQDLSSIFRAADMALCNLSLFFNVKYRDKVLRFLKGCVSEKKKEIS
jgi:hypothetical protein